MSEPHVIQLNGPWEIIARNDGDRAKLQRINIRTREDWSQIGDPISQTNLEELQLSRQFNWPATGAMNIQLEIIGSPPDRLLLNDQELEFRTVNGQVVADVYDPRPTGNRLLICYDRANLGDAGPAISGVCLKISVTGAVKD
ncbi:MAG: hypothetical protein ACR2NP_07045 [Pirellulaceae bacterium]